MNNDELQQNKNKVIVNGEEIHFEKGTGNSVTVINEKVYVDGKEYIDGEWKRTLKGLFYKYF